VNDFLQSPREPIREGQYQQLRQYWASPRLPVARERAGKDRSLPALTWTWTNGPVGETVGETHWSPMWAATYYAIAGDTIGRRSEVTTGNHTTSFFSPLQHADFTPFRRLGFPIWIEERMQGHGLLSVPFPRAATGFADHKPQRATAWRSVLTMEEREEARTRYQGWDESHNHYPRNWWRHNFREPEEEGELMADWLEHYCRQKERSLYATHDESEEASSET
jgi:hypothetical protein